MEPIAPEERVKDIDYRLQLMSDTRLASEFRPPADLDDFLQRISFLLEPCLTLVYVYSYYDNKGFWASFINILVSFLEFTCILAFATVLVCLIDYHQLFAVGQNQTNIGPAFGWQSSRPKPLLIVLAIAFYPWWFLQLYLLFYTVLERYEMKQFYEDRLGISEKMLGTIEWHEVVKELLTKEKVPKLSAKHEDLSPLDVVHHIMRRENFIIALHNRHLLDLRMCGKKYAWQTQTLDWSLEYGLWNPIFEAMALGLPIRENEIPRLTTALSLRLRLMGLVSIIGSPFVLMYLIVYYFFIYTESSPGLLGSRHWSRVARTKFRAFNELPHQLRLRLQYTTEPVEYYLAQFPSPPLVKLASFGTFLAGGLAAIIIMFGIINEDTLTYGLLGDRSLLWWLGVFLALAAACRALLPDQYYVYQPKFYLDQIMTHTHYKPKHWVARPAAAFDEVSDLYEFKLLSALREIASVFMAPMILLFIFPRNITDILRFFAQHTKEESHVGLVCDFADFDALERHGNSKYGAPTGAPKEQRTRRGKLEKSIIAFKGNNPTWQPLGDAARMIGDVTRFADSELAPLQSTLLQSRFGTSPQSSQLRTTALPASGLASASGAASVFMLTELHATMIGNRQENPSERELHAPREMYLERAAPRGNDV